MIRLRQVLSGLLAMAFLLIANPSQTDLVDQGSSVLDTDTGLEWLKMEETTGLSAYEIAIEGVGGFYDDGWVHGTVDQIETLFINAGIPTPFDGTQSPAGFDGANLLITLLGSTGSFGNSVFIQAFSGPVPLSPGFPLFTPVVITSNTPTGQVGGADSPGFGVPSTVQNDTIGNYLVREAVAPIDIDIKPGSYPNSINPRSKGKIPVAILSTMDFDAPADVDVESLTFGPTGEEQSLAFCNESPEDVNDDGIEDLVCHFYTQAAGFECGDAEGFIKGHTVDGTHVEGLDSVRIVPSACR
jgi:hypothetical protein